MQNEDHTDEAETLELNAKQSQKHLELLSSFLSERDKDEVSDEDSDEDEIHLDEWSADEKDCFFAALCSYSALRPDLIAESIGTKNVAQVCVYLSALEDAAENCDAELPLRSDLDIAMEVSDEWLEAEEEQAAFFRDVELAWTQDIDPQDEPAADRADMDVNLVNMRRDALKVLSIHHLKVIDKILRNAGAPSGIAPAPAPKAEPESTAELSSAERRRLRKRLHMRRKRAELSGTDAITSTQRLQRGRKRKIAEVSSRAASQSGGDRANSESEEEEQSADSADEDRPKKRQRKRGLTREQKILGNFTGLGIDTAVFHDAGLDLFHLHPLGRFMALYQEAFSTLEARITAISSDTIRLFGIILSDFVTQVIHHSIILREQEILLKGRSKVWRRENDDIYPDTIERVVAILGFPATKTEALEHLCEEDVCSENLANEVGQPNDEVRSEGDDEPDDFVRDGSPLSSEDDGSFLSHVELSPPLVRLRKVDSDSSESLLPLETDEELLDEELSDEEILDERDQALEESYLNELWTTYELDTAAFQ